MHTGRCAADCIRFADPADPELVAWSFLEPSWSLLEPLGGRLGAVLEPLEAMLEPFGKLPRPTWTRPDNSWQHVADLLNCLLFDEFHRFSMFFLDFSTPRNGSEGILELFEAT